MHSSEGGEPEEGELIVIGGSTSLDLSDA